jgi:hypothetical protein
VERHDRLGSDATRNFARLPRRQVILARRMLHVFVQENAFDEKHVHPGEQLRKRLHVRLRVAKVRNVANALAGNHVEDQLA